LTATYPDVEPDIVLPRLDDRADLRGDVYVRDDHPLPLEALRRLHARRVALCTAVAAVDLIQGLAREVVARAGVVSKRELLDDALDLASGVGVALSTAAGEQERGARGGRG